MLSGELTVAGKRALIGEFISMVSICLPFPKGRANWRRFKNLRIPTAHPLPLRHFENCLSDNFLEFSAVF
jgi:hypothetical protein